MSLLTGLRRLSRTLPIGQRQLHRLRRIVGLGFQIAAYLRYGAGRKRQTPQPGPVCVVGFHGSVLGIGEAARAFSAALRAAGAEVIDWDISARFGHAVKLTGVYGCEPPPEAAAMVIFLNPRELVQLTAMTSGVPFKGRFCVGAWAWELETAPANWRSALRYIDEVWACSRFVADAVLSLGPSLPVRVMLHPLLPSEAPSARERFGLPDDVVAVLTAFDIRSGFARKNPIGAVRAFRRATVQAKERSLMICKVAGAEAAPELLRALEAEIGSAGDVIVMKDWLTGAEMATLVSSVDIVLSLHRSEGFGLLPAQAMMAGKAVVATRWSGNLDYMTDDVCALVDYRLIPVQDSQGLYGHGRWADPDIEQAAGKLAALIDDAGERRALGLTAQAHIRRVLDPVRLGRQARTWLGHGDFGV
jgi:glycosyltransferase involved in cell wall biosynthesis